MGAQHLWAERRVGGPHRLWLTHYSPMITDPEADLPQAQSIFPAAVCGADEMQITLQYEEA